MSLPQVAIVGAPNVGKSTLFNRLVGGRNAIVTDEPGVTRDRLYGDVRVDGLAFRLVDTGGLTPNTSAPFSDEILAQATIAIREADLILLVLDARAGATALDRDVVQLIRRSGVPLLLLANKIDGTKTESLTSDLYDLGLGEPVPVSAEHGRGVSELLDSIEESLRASGKLGSEDGETTDEPSGGVAVHAPRPLRVAIVGRPNVGKSSMLNRLVGEERVVVSEIPGTTRDSIDTLLELGDRRFVLIDTAGLRRRGKIDRGVEQFSAVRARHNIDGCDVAVLVLDASEGFVAQDAHIAGYVLDSYKPFLVAVNKWDLIESRENEAKKWLDLVQSRLRFAKDVPMVLVSALTGQRVSKVLDVVTDLHEQGGHRISTAEVNRWLREVEGREPSSHGRPLRLFYATQTGVHPPRFVVFCNDPKRVHFSFHRRMENSLRDRYGFGATPIRIQFRSRRETQA